MKQRALGTLKAVEIRDFYAEDWRESQPDHANLHDYCLLISSLTHRLSMIDSLYIFPVHFQVCSWNYNFLHKWFSSKLTSQFLFSFLFTSIPDFKCNYYTYLRVVVVLNKVRQTKCHRALFNSQEVLNSYQFPSRTSTFD